MEMESCVPPGFRFHPTEEELVGYYLKRKIQSMKIDIEVINDIDLYNMEPWDIQARCKLGYDEQNEWYFFSHKDRKYPTGTRTNRATAAGFWKATGRDKAVLSKDRIIGMRKTLVFYKGRAPNGRKTDWIMHEYRLQLTLHGAPQEEGWVVCRAFKKTSQSQRPGFEAYTHAYHPNIISQPRSPPFSNPGATKLLARPNQGVSFHHPFASDPGLVSSHSFLENTNQIIDLPQLDSPSTHSTSFAAKEDLEQFYFDDYNEERSNCSDQCIDWKNLNNFNTSSQANGKTSYLHPTMPSISETYATKLGSPVSHYLGFFPDL